MDLLDLLLVIVALLFAISGYRQGFIVGMLSFAGFLGGLFLGIWLVPIFLHRFAAGLVTAAVALCAVLALAIGLQVLATTIGGHLRRRLVWQPAQQVDAVAGSAVGVLSVLLVGWIVGLMLVHSASSSLVSQAKDSSILRALSQALPNSAQNWAGSFSSLLSRSSFPQVFSPFTKEQITNVAPPDPAVLDSRAVSTSRGSIVKIVGNAPSCGKQIEGSGFVFAPDHVMTNAHVVGGVRHPDVQVLGAGQQYSARVVLYDPERDIAVLYVPGLSAAPLAFDDNGTAGDEAVVAGFPENGPFHPVAARIREQIRARGQDIYSNNDVTRSVFSLYAVVLQGNSGGPLLSPDGQVFGVVFAKSVEDDNTGYALTSQEVAPDATSGRSLTQPVSTGACAI